MEDENQEIFVLKRLKNLDRIRRFENEIKAVSELSHPNIVKLVDFDFDSPKPYLVTEYCAGGSLSKADLSNWNTVERLHLFSDICDGVGHAQARGIIHRDLKPDNIFLSADHKTPVVGDFGICYLTDQGERITVTDEAVGARRYTAPELEDGRLEHVNRSADVYSLGKILYWLFAGRVFDREKHRESRWDLTAQSHDLPQHEVVERAFINELLDWSVILDPSIRFGGARQFHWHVERTIRRIIQGNHVIDLNVRHICNYCGVGNYRLGGDSTVRDSESGFDDVEGFGIRHVGNVKWIVLYCDHCGHVQQFRTDILRQNPWKEKVRPW